jgi:hypothetical protein
MREQPTEKELKALKSIKKSSTGLLNIKEFVCIEV